MWISQHVLHWNICQFYPTRYIKWNKSIHSPYCFIDKQEILYSLMCKGKSESCERRLNKKRQNERDSLKIAEMLLLGSSLDFGRSLNVSTKTNGWVACETITSAPRWAGERWRERTTYWDDLDVFSGGNKVHAKHSYSFFARLSFFMLYLQFKFWEMIQFL